MKELIEKLEELKQIITTHSEINGDYTCKLLTEAIQALSQSEGESKIKEIERRLLIVKSEPNGIVRETMLDDLLINLTPQTK